MEADWGEGREQEKKGEKASLFFALVAFSKFLSTELLSALKEAKCGQKS